MRRKNGLFVPILLMVGIFFFLMLGLMVLNHAPPPDVNATPGLAESANESAPLREPVRIGWQGVTLAVVACGVLAAAGMLVRAMRGRRRRRRW